MLTQFAMSTESTGGNDAPIKKLRAELAQRMQDLIVWDKERRNIADNLLVKARTSAVKLEQEVSAAANGIDAFAALFGSKSNAFTEIKDRHKKALSQVLDLTDRLKALDLKISQERELAETLMHGINALKGAKKSALQPSVEVAVESDAAAGTTVKP